MRECGCDEPTLQCLHVDGTEMLRLYDHSINNYFAYRNKLKPRYSVVSRDEEAFFTPFIAAAKRIYAIREQRIRAAS